MSPVSPSNNPGLSLVISGPSDGMPDSGPVSSSMPMPVSNPSVLYSQMNRRFYYRPEEVRRLIPLIGTIYPDGK